MSEKPESAIATALPKCSINQHVLNECNLAGPEKGAPGKKVAAAEPAAGVADVPAKADAPQDIPGAYKSPPSKFGTEEQFMKYAPKMFRQELHLPANASSEAVVDKMLDTRVQQFQKQPENEKKTALASFGIDKKTTDQILGHKTDSNKTLENILLEKEKAYLDIPAGKNTPDVYKKLEDGLLRDDYRAITGVEKVLNFRKASEKDK